MRAIETPRLILRNFRASDAPDLRQMILLYNQSPLHVYDRPWPTSEEAIQGIVDWFETDDEFLAVCLKETGRLIGLISLNQSDHLECVEFEMGYIFNAGYHGKGYATESCQALISHAFTNLHAQRIIAGTAAVNEPSRRLLARLGFKPVSESTECFQSAPDGTPIAFRGIYYALTREEWASAQPG